MQKTIEKTTTYKLINAGHLARQTMLIPLKAHGLTLGDDAILFALSNSNGESENVLSQLTSLDKKGIVSRLERLSALGLVQYDENSKTNTAKVQLSAKGVKATDILVAHWQQLDDALVGELTKKQSKKLKKILKRFIKLLSY